MLRSGVAKPGPLAQLGFGRPLAELPCLTACSPRRPGTQRLRPLFCHAPAIPRGLLFHTDFFGSQTPRSFTKEIEALLACRCATACLSWRQASLRTRAGRSCCLSCSSACSQVRTGRPGGSRVGLASLRASTDADLAVACAAWRGLQQPEIREPCARGLPAPPPLACPPARALRPGWPAGAFDLFATAATLGPTLPALALTTGPRPPLQASRGWLSRRCSSSPAWRATS